MSGIKTSGVFAKPQAVQVVVIVRPDGQDPQQVAGDLRTLLLDTRMDTPYEVTDVQLAGRMQPIMRDPAKGGVQRPEEPVDQEHWHDPQGHESLQMNRPTTSEIATMHNFTDALYDWLREQIDASEVSNHDGSTLSFILHGFGDVSISVTPTGHTL